MLKLNSRPLLSLEYFHALQLLRTLHDLMLIEADGSRLAQAVRTEGTKVWKSLSLYEKDCLLEESFQLDEVSSILSKITAAVGINKFSDPAIQLNVEEIEIDVESDETAEMIFK